MRVESFPAIANNESKILIVGTMPGNESLVKKEYYAYQNNHFWDILFRILKNDFDFFSFVQGVLPYEEKIKLLYENKIALWDTLKYCDRKGNLDKDIRNEIKNDFEPFLKKHTGIAKILFNGKRSYGYFQDSNTGVLNNKNISFKVLNSTSSTNPNNTFEILNEWKKELKP